MASLRFSDFYLFVLSMIFLGETQSSDSMSSPSFPNSMASSLTNPAKVKVQTAAMPEVVPIANSSENTQKLNLPDAVQGSEPLKAALKTKQSTQKFDSGYSLTARGHAQQTKGGLKSPQPLENNSMTLIEDRKPWTVTLKPLSVNFATLIPGLRKKAQLINGFGIDPYRSSWGYLMNRPDRAGVGYDFEAGLMVTRNVEIFTILGFSVEQPLNKVIIGVSPTPGDVLAFDFKQRHNYEVSLGSRYYWNSIKPWFPFVGFMGTITFQDSVRSDAFNVDNLLAQSYSSIGSLTLQGRKMLFGWTLMAGADYQITPLFAVTFSVGLRYMPRTHLTYTSIAGKSISCRDNRNMWSLPVTVSLKFTF